MEYVECDERRQYRHQPTTPGRNLHYRSVYFRGAGHILTVSGEYSSRSRPIRPSFYSMSWVIVTM